MMEWLITKNMEELGGIQNEIDNVVSKTEAEELDKWTTRGVNANQYQINLNDISNSLYFVKNTIIQALKNKGRNVKLTPISAWTVIGGEDTYHIVHNHTKPSKVIDYGIVQGDNSIKENKIASVLYLKVDIKKTLHKHGDFFFFLNEIDSIKYHQLSPVKGDLSFFPTHIMHGTYPQGPGIRQTLNIDWDVSE